MSPTTLAVALIVVGTVAVIEAVVDIRQWSTIRGLRRKVATRDGIIDEKSMAVYESEQAALNLRKQCDNLIVENARLRQVVGEKTEYVEELALELAKAQSDPKPTLREERLSGRFPAWPEYTYEATYQPPATDGDPS